MTVSFQKSFNLLPFYYTDCEDTRLSSFAEKGKFHQLTPPLSLSPCPSPMTSIPLQTEIPSSIVSECPPRTVFSDSCDAPCTSVDTNLKVNEITIKEELTCHEEEEVTTQTERIITLNAPDTPTSLVAEPNSQLVVRLQPPDQCILPNFELGSKEQPKADSNVDKRNLPGLIDPLIGNDPKGTPPSANFVFPNVLTAEVIRVQSNGNAIRSLKIVLEAMTGPHRELCPSGASVLLPLHSTDDQWCLVALDQHSTSDGFCVPGLSLSFPFDLLGHATSAAIEGRATPIHFQLTNTVSGFKTFFDVYATPELPRHVFVGPFPANIVENCSPQPCMIPITYTCSNASSLLGTLCVKSKTEPTAPAVSSTETFPKKILVKYPLNNSEEMLKFDSIDVATYWTALVNRALQTEVDASGQKESQGEEEKAGVLNWSRKRPFRNSFSSIQLQKSRDQVKEMNRIQLGNHVSRYL